MPTGRFSARKPWVPTAWTVASTSSLPPCGPVWAETNVGDQPFVVMCAAGVRSWIGYRIVRHASFNVTMLSGGIQTLRAWLGEKAWAVLVTGEG